MTRRGWTGLDWVQERPPCGVLLLLQCHDTCDRADAAGGRAVAASAHAADVLVVMAMEP